RVGTPAGVAEPFPAVVVEPVAPDGRAAVVRGAAADHPRPLERQPPRAVRGAAVVAPIVPARRQAARVQQIRRPLAAVEWAVVRPRLEHEHRAVALGGDQPRHHRAGRPTPDHDQVGRLRQARRRHGASLGQNAYALAAKCSSKANAASTWWRAMHAKETQSTKTTNAVALAVAVPPRFRPRWRRRRGVGPCRACCGRAGPLLPLLALVAADGRTLIVPVASQVGCLLSRPKGRRLPYHRRGAV